MTRYRKAWSSAVVLLGIIGAWAALDALSVSGVLTILLLALFLGGSFALVPLPEGEPRPWRRAMTVGAASGAAVVAAAGLTALLGAVGAALVVVTAMASPPVLRRTVAWHARRHDGTNPDPANRSAKPRIKAREVCDSPHGGAPSGSAEPTFLGEPWMAVEPTSLDDAGLCLAWRKTYVALQHASALAWKLHVVRRRQELLDELERRNAKGFSAWLSAGARAAGDPSRYITAAPGTATHPYDR